MSTIPAAPIDISTLALTLNNPSALRSSGLAVRSPTTTPISKMGLDAAAIAGLTPAAAKLTKADLENLAQGTITANTAELTVKDISSIQTAFRSGFGQAMDVNISCCCCTPCCCAVAVTTH